MIIKKICYIITINVLLVITGCSSKTADSDQKKKKIIGFQTNQTMFIATVDNIVSTKKERNALIDEFIITSNIQCQYYLNNPLRKSSSNPRKQGLYMDIFDGVSQVFGVKNITDGAKRLYKKDDKGGSNKAKIAYENALSPEIKRGVEIARENYAQKMILRKTRMIESYTISMLKRDMKNYDKLCKYETGLIEINKALKKAQQRPRIQPFSPKIDPTAIKNKVAAVTKEAEANEEKEKEKESINQIISDTQELDDTGF